MLQEIKDPDCDANVYGTNYIYVSTATIFFVATVAISNQIYKIIK